MFKESKPQEETKPMSTKEKLSLIKDDMETKLGDFRIARDSVSSFGINFQRMKEGIEKELLFGKEELLKITQETTDTNMLAEIETAEKEIEKEMLSLKIEWLEKQIHDLRVPEGQISIEKTKLLNEVAFIKRGELLRALTDCVGALRSEQTLLSEKGINPEDSKRLQYINRRARELEAEFKEIEKIG